MANHKSAEKRAKQSIKKRLRNKAIKTSVKNAIKSVRAAASEKNDELPVLLNKAKSVIDKASKKGVIHKKTASRNISKLSKLV